MKKSKIDFGRILSIFVQILLTISVTLIIIFGSGYVIRTIFSGADSVQITALADEISRFNSQSVIDTTPVTAVYAIDETDKSIKHIILEILHCESRKLTYISIPCNSRFTISDELYRELSAGLPTIPQIVTLSECCRYYTWNNNSDSNTQNSLDSGIDSKIISGAESASKMISDKLGIKIPYTIILSDSIYDTIFLADPDKCGNVTGFTTSFIEKLEAARGNSVYDLFAELSEHTRSNITLPDKLVYLETYDSLSVTDVLFRITPGESGNAAFTPDFESMKLFLYKAMY